MKIHKKRIRKPNIVQNEGQTFDRVQNLIQKGEISS